MVGMQYYFRLKIFSYTPLWITFDDFLYYTLEYCSLWYVPFVMVLFLFYYVHVAFVSLNDNYKKFFMLMFFISAVFVGRDDYNPLHNVLYFSILYLSGIYCAIHYEKLKQVNIISTIALIELYLLFNYLSISYGHFGAVHKNFGENIFILDYFVFVKLLLSILLLRIFLWFSEQPNNLIKKLLYILAKYSFSIFFCIILWFIYYWNILLIICTIPT